MLMIKITRDEIEMKEVIESVQDHSAGAVLPFIGTVRNDNGMKGLFYEAHDRMAVREMEKIAQAAREKWRLEKIAVVHRVGWVPVGEASIVAVVAAAHRREAFEACRFIMERIKKDVPIWKKKERYPRAAI